MASHTPGPLGVVHASGGVYVTSPRKDGSRATVALISDERHVDGDSAERRTADARLIAAAPDLLAVLSEAAADMADMYGADAESCECGTFDEKGSCWHTRARAAIAKAEGK